MLWVLLAFGIVITVLGVVVIVAVCIEKGSDDLGPILVGIFLLFFGILLISAYFYTLGTWADPTTVNLKSGHVYEVLDSMPYKKKYLVSFQEVIPHKGREQIGLFRKVPPELFRPKQEDDKQVYLPFEVESQKPLK